MSTVGSFSGRTFAALRVRNFRLYFIGQGISNSGTWMQSVAQGWLVLQLSGSALDLGYAIALQYVPMLLFGFYGGLIVDRFAKRPILYVTQSAAGLFALLLGLLTLTHHVSVPVVYLVALALGIVNLFDVPARQAFVQEMVGRDLIANAVSLNSVLVNGGRLVGPAVAAGTIAVFGTASCFLINAASYLAVLLALGMMRSSEFQPLRTVEKTRGQMRDGLRYVFTNPLLRSTVLSVAVVGTFAFNFTTTLPTLARTTFHQTTATHYGYLMGAMGLGAILGGLFIAHRSNPTPRLLATLGVAFGVTMTLAALSPSLLVAELLLVPTGAFSIAFVSTANATLQLNSSDQMRGRVMSLHGTAFLGTTPIGAPIVGWIIRDTSPRVGMLLGSLLTLTVGIVLSARLRSHAQPPVTA